MKLDKDCLKKILSQFNPEKADALLEQLLANGVDTLNKLENLPVRIGSPTVLGVSTYGMVHFIVAALKANGGCGDGGTPAPTLTTTATYKNILSEQPMVVKKKKDGSPVGEKNDDTSL